MTGSGHAEGDLHQRTAGMAGRAGREEAPSRGQRARAGVPASAGMGQGASAGEGAQAAPEGSRQEVRCWSPLRRPRTDQKQGVRGHRAV